LFTEELIMAINPASVAAAYKAVANIGGGNAAGAAAGMEASGQPFGAFLDDAMKNAMSTMRAGEDAAAQGATGKADIVQVVNAVTAAELTLETVVAIRDRVIGAYQDILRMPI
jgi:flagellar hook-basal body complex protein FliE